jgi:transcriptional regulator with XRE-family HTH domain
METQGLRLKDIRCALDLSQDEIAAKFGISRQYWSSFEKDREILNNEKLVKLTKYFNVNINYLLTGEGEMFITKD